MTSSALCWRYEAESAYCSSLHPSAATSYLAVRLIRPCPAGPKATHPHPIEGGAPPSTLGFDDIAESRTNVCRRCDSCTRSRDDSQCSAADRPKRPDRSSQRAQPLGVLADEAQHPAPVPERPARPEPAVRERVPAVRHHRGRHVPPLPPRLREPVAEVDLLPVHPEALVEPPYLVEGGAPDHQESAQHPVRLHRLRGPLVEVIMAPLPFERRKEEPKRRSPHQRAPDGREARSEERRVGKECR